MKRFIQKVLGILVCACMLICGVSSPVMAHAGEMDMQIEPRMTYIASYTVYLAISSTGVATIDGTVYGKAGVTHTSVKVTLQQSALVHG